MEIYQNTLAGFIRDEDKIVTYKWLSKELEIHVDLAKQILQVYWNNNKNKEKLSSTVLIIGHIKDGGMRIELVKDENVESASEKYENIISKHIYSLQKVLDDMRLLVGIDNGCIPAIGGIKCEKSVLLTDEEYYSRRYGENFKCNAEKKKNSDNKSIVNEKDKKESVEITLQTNESENTIEKKSLIKEPQKSFTEKSKGASKKPIQSQQKGFSNLFGKVSSANKKISALNKSDTDKNNKDQVEKAKEEEEKEEEVINIDNQLKVEKEKSNDSSPKIVKSAANDNKIKRGTKRGNKFQNSNNNKKHKRIIRISDSDNSDDEIDATVNENLPDDLPIEDIEYIEDKKVSPQPVEKINGKFKKRKTIDKTFADEDGFIITKKVEIFESCSEEDEPTPIPTPRPVQSSPTKSSSIKPEKNSKKSVEFSKNKKANKQTTLMSFFKKL